MAYTPELNIRYSAALRRIAWALDLPMTKTIEKVFEYLSKTLDKNKVCISCKDKSQCSECLFN